MSYQEKLSGNTQIYVVLGVLLIVFLVLAAQYESWILPLMILLSVPMVVTGAIGGLNFIANSSQHFCTSWTCFTCCFGSKKCYFDC